MSWDPFRVLGVEQDVDERRLRARFRRLVHELHPDRRAGDPRATERLREVVAAYETLRARLRGARPMERRGRPSAERAAAPRDRLRYGCARCDDTFAFEGECPRCEVPLADTWAASPASPCADDPRVGPFIAELEARGEPRESLLDTHAPMVTLVGLTLAGALALGVYVPVGTMFLGYALVLLGVYATAQRKPLEL